MYDEWFRKPTSRVTTTTVFLRIAYEIDTYKFQPEPSKYNNIALYILATYLITQNTQSTQSAQSTSKYSNYCLELSVFEHVYVYSSYCQLIGIFRKDILLTIFTIEIQWGFNRTEKKCTLALCSTGLYHDYQTAFFTDKVL
ncbi:hypothetical protein PHYBLDRAFT_73397 [Phycomyces blakesleeanus NRRL 1555(-)]|uniref:Uncharacterized protein n=1 Tax=Phycomyces blakesleeanus (strain ATCC 8743b / DSM 1359 / FGSC 10004 / NBRC 33097 / NRRL 1555) TaxID=763407 RepID=A0A167L7K8_PHYB8|nr:hypothetical protein PHYBLDRAFT_73397 [Phycomyces blakesleeanus NRRL 1555(-)]OAD69769.1 hypothetical protein PHYBLDRAFT_73397 [Phycomyces blakesleeanus NRRL 1555(-)]|eukprot:XP_018287809.1 hypothetical protein PHYBLDRAFT_73397 [Phycomyces blakesleeanus NRRL 1555(-)]